MSRLSSGRAAEHRFALVFFARDAHRAGVDIPLGISALLNDLTAAISDTGSAEVGRESIDGMRTWGTPEETGRQVGLTGRRVRMLCAEGLVAHRLTGGGHYLVDLEDLQRHLSAGGMNSEAQAAADLASELPMGDPLGDAARRALADLASEAVRVGTPLRDASVDPRPEDLAPMRAVDGRPGVFKQAQVDEPEYLAAVAEQRRQKEGNL